MPFQIIRDNIVRTAADAIVNTANPDVTVGTGVDEAVYEAAGADLLLKERKKIGKMVPGQAALTPAFKLNAKYIIHTVGPVWQDGKHKEFEQLKACYENSLQLAAKYGCKSIAFPLISTGAYGFPKDKALEIAISAISRFLLQSEMYIYLVVFDEDSFKVSGKLFDEIEEFIDENYVDEHLRGSDRKPIALYEVMGEIADSCCSYSKKMLDDVMDHIGESFQKRLLRLIDERNLKDSDVYKKANIDRKLFSKIRCNEDYRPKKKTALALAIALELNLDDTKDLLGRAELALSPSSKFDLIIEYFIENEVYDIYTINMALFKHDQPMLGE